MKKTTVYDVPLRVFHWLFALTFVVAFGIAKIVEDESPLFYYHILAGLFLGYLLLFRIIWGFIGTRYARFSSFRLHPPELLQYFRQLMGSGTRLYPGHNPASSYSALAMFALGGGLVVTGILMAMGYKNDFFEDIHELLANGFLLTVLLHLFGLIWHHLSHRDALYLSMITGEKTTEDEAAGVARTWPVVGMLVVVLGIFWVGYLRAHYDEGTRTLRMFGLELRAGEVEHESESGADNEDEHEAQEEYEEDDDEHEEEDEDGLDAL
ncbi:MAG: cytochrome b [Calditrichaeota bacterium]|nr:cytochrome b [Calditrichota bacterium]